MLSFLWRNKVLTLIMILIILCICFFVYKKFFKKKKEEPFHNVANSIVYDSILVPCVLNDPQKLSKHMLNLISKSSNKTNIYFVVLQPPGSSCFLEYWRSFVSQQGHPHYFMEQVRVVKEEEEKNKISQLLRKFKEKYVLIISPEIDIKKDWDVECVSMLENERTILTSPTTTYSFLRCVEIGENSVLLESVPLVNPFEVMFWSSFFSFSPSHFWLHTQDNFKSDFDFMNLFFTQGAKLVGWVPNKYAHHISVEVSLQFPSTTTKSWMQATGVNFHARELETKAKTGVMSISNSREITAKYENAPNYENFLNRVSPKLKHAPLDIMPLFGGELGVN